MIPPAMTPRTASGRHLRFPAPRQRLELARSHGAVVLVIAVGGGFGAVARYALAQALPTRPGQFPWGTFVGVIIGVWLTRRIAEPFTNRPETS